MLSRSFRLSAAWRKVAIASIVFFAVARVVATYPILNSTSDEPAHISAGMEWLQWGNYSYELQHPPLARIAVALGPYLKGLRSAAKQDTVAGTTAVIFDDGNEILYSDGNYWTNLNLARLGSIPFLILTCILTYVWGRRYFSAGTGLLAAGFIACNPPILGQAGLATLDIACVATVLWALYQFMRWLAATADWKQSVLLGAATAIAFLTKFSSIPFLLACYAAAILYIALTGRIDKQAREAVIRRTGFVLVAVIAAFFVMWAGYRFTLVPLASVYGVHPTIDAALQNHAILKSGWDLLLKIPLPLTEFMLGIRDLWRHDMLGHDSYLFGEYRNTGWWYFFPVVVFFKTPIGLMLLTASGAALLCLRRSSITFAQTMTALFPRIILLIAMTSRIDAGVRHILPIYPFAAVLAGYAVMQAFAARRSIAIAAVILSAAIFIEGWQAHPDYLAHFNLLAGRHPEKILAESDLDLGQDLHRLSLRLKELHADHVSIGYFGSAPLNHADLPPYRVLGHEDPVPGYVAVSLRFLNLQYAKDKGYAWLKSYTPVERIGKSIDLYYWNPQP